MALSAYDAAVPLRSAELVDALVARDAGRPLWVWVTESAAGGRLRTGDAVAIDARPSHGGLLPIVDAEGLAAIGAPEDPRAALGFVVALWRHRRCWKLDRQPWRTALSRGSLGAWRAAERAWQLATPVVNALEQLASAPSTEQAEAGEARFYGTTDLLTGYGRGTFDGLWASEETIAARYLKEGGSVLVVGCGTGRESIALAARGHRVFGVDVCEAAVALAKERAREAGHDTASFETMSLSRLDLPRDAFDLVILASDVLCGTPGRAVRVEALSRMRQATRAGGVVVVAASAGRGPARVLLEAPRAAMRRLGITAGEPGDRSAWQGPPPVRRYYHSYADDAEIAGELASAGLAYEGRVGGFVVARGQQRGASVRASFARPSLFGRALEIARVAAALPRVERARRTSGPAALVAEMRALARGAPRRNPLERDTLRSVIALCDRALPRGAGCYRRALLEMALDSGAAEEGLVLGMRRHGMGHAWVGAAAAPEERFDWVLEV